MNMLTVALVTINQRISSIACAGLVGLPFGLLLVMVCGAELFTGNIALVATAVSTTLPTEA